MKGTSMTARKMINLAIVILGVTFFSGNAQADVRLQEYFNSAARAVNAADDPAQKRAIFNNEFKAVSGALTAVESMPQTSDGDRAGIERYKSAILEEQNELNGTNGYARVADGQLNAFSHYVVQNMEQADQMITITISVVTLLLIIIIILLLI